MLLSQILIHYIQSVEVGGLSMNSAGYVSAHVGERLALTQSNHLHTDGTVIRW
jgi:hypothetical protein